MGESIDASSLISPALPSGPPAAALINLKPRVRRTPRRASAAADGLRLEQVLVAYSAVEAAVRRDPRELEAELETIQTAHTIAENLNRAGIRAQTYVVCDVPDVDRIAREFDIDHTLVFNLCEHLQGDSHRDGEVAQRMMDLNIQFTGASVSTLARTLDKGRTKARLLAAGVPTATYQIFLRADEPIRVPFPAIVKPLAEDASIGIDRDSVVHDEVSLQQRVERILDTYCEPALAEEYIDGREFNVGMWGNGKLYMLPIAELDFGEWPTYQRFLHFDAKWNPEAIEYQTMYVRCPADIDSELAEKIGRVARQAYKVMGCRDYARVDMRLHRGEPHVLEVNPNPCLAPDAGFPNAARVAGYDYPTMVSRIAHWAWWRRGRRGY